MRTQWHDGMMARWYDHYDGIVVGILRFRRPLLLGAGGVRAEEMGPGTDPPESSPFQPNPRDPNPSESICFHMIRVRMVSLVVVRVERKERDLLILICMDCMYIFIYIYYILYRLNIKY